MAEKTFKLNHSRATELLGMLKQVQNQEGDYLATLEEVVGAFEYYVEYTAEPERVIFRKFPHNGKVCALLPDRVNDDGYVGFVDENGRHMVTAPSFGDTVAADELEYRDLLNELRRQDFYNIRIVKRAPNISR